MAKHETDRTRAINGLMTDRRILIQKLVGLNRDATSYPVIVDSLKIEIDRIDVVIGSLCGIGEGPTVDVVDIDPEKDQVVVVRCDQVMGQDQITGITQSIQETVPEWTRILVLDGGASLSIVNNVPDPTVSDN